MSDVDAGNTQYFYALQSYFTLGFGRFKQKFKEIPLNKKSRKEIEILDQGEWKRLRAVLPARFLLLFDVLFWSGLRIKELRHLKVKDITLKGKLKGRIKVQKGKGGKYGEATITEEQTDKVSKYINDNDLGLDAFLFTTR